MASRRQSQRAAFRTLYRPAVRGAAGFTYIELLVTFSLTVLILASILTLSGELVREGEHNADQIVLQREASALHFLLLNEMKQGYDFRVMGGDLYFHLDTTQVVKLEHRQSQLARLISKWGRPYEGYVLLSRHVESVQFQPDMDRQGVVISVEFRKGEATATFRTYWRSRIERSEGSA